MNDVISHAESAFQKERGLSLVEWGGLVSLALGFIILGGLTTNYIRSHTNNGSYGCGPYSCCSNSISPATY